MIIVKNIFFPIGQGGFMYSRIENNGKKELDFIYDCGSDKKSINIDVFLNKIPLNYFDDTRNKKPLIDYLYISHFDTDHINGIKKLCELVEFRKIIYPFHDDNYRLLNTIYQISKSDDTELDTNILKIIYNPEEYLKNIVGDAILLKIEPNEEAFRELNFKEIKEETSETEANKGYHIKPIETSNIQWVLYSFMPALPNDKKVYEKIADAFNKKFSNLKNDIAKGVFPKKPPPKFKGDIEKEFPEYVYIKKILKKCTNKASDPFNRSSLMLYSGIKSPKTQSEYSLTSTKIIFPKNEYPSLSDCLVPFLSNFRYRYEPKAPKGDTYALLLTGDAQLKGTEWHGYLTGLKENITTVNLPHHGSSNNIDNETFKDFENIKNFLTFAGNRTYPHRGEKHPNIKAIQDAIEAQPTASIIHVNQLQGLFEMVVLDNVNT